MPEVIHDARPLLGHMREAEAVDFLESLTISSKNRSQLRETYRRAAAAATAVPVRNLDARTAEIDGFTDKLAQVKGNERMKELVAGKTWSFKLVEVDKLVCVQKYVDLDHIERISKGLDLNSMEAAIDFCLTERFSPQDFDLTEEKSANLYAVHVEGSDLRVFKSARQTDEQASCITVSFQVGWRPAQIQVVHLEDRYILRNGYHRAYLAKSQGVGMIPCVLIEGQNYSDLDNEGQPVFFAEGQIMSERPPMFSDFFSDAISPLVKMRAMGKVIVLQPEEYALPVDQAREYLAALPSSRGSRNLDVTVTSTFLNVPIDREGWNQYHLDDGTMLYMRQVARGVRAYPLKDGTPGYLLDVSEVIAAAMCPNRALGEPSAEKYSEDQLKSSVVVKRVGFKKLVETRNEYILPNNDKAILVLRLINVSKTDKFNEFGEPIYLYETKPIISFIRSRS